MSRTYIKVFEFLYVFAGAWLFHYYHPELGWLEYCGWVFIMMMLVQLVTNHYFPKIK